MPRMSAALFDASVSGWHAGTGFPDASNTGVPAGTALTTVGTGPGQVSSGPGWALLPAHGSTPAILQVTGSNVTLSRLYTTYGIAVFGSHVTVSQCEIVNTNLIAGGGNVVTNAVDSFTLADCTIHGVAADANNAMLLALKDKITGSQVASTNTSVLRCNIYWGGVGVQIEQGLIQDCYIHDILVTTSGGHLECVNTNGAVSATGVLHINHNTLFNPVTQTACVYMSEDFGPQNNRLIENNLMAGGGYAIYGGNAGGQVGTWGPPTNMTVINNRFSTVYYPNVGFSGHTTDWAAGPTNTWAGNTILETGAPMPASAF